MSDTNSNTKNRTSRATRTAHPKRAASNSSDRLKGDSCEECNTGKLQQDAKTGEYFCPECGFVPDNQSNVRLGPDWRNTKSSGNNNQKSRVGRSETETLHDKGLSTHIGWRDQDANGNSISNRKKRQVNRLREWNKRSKFNTSQEQGTAKGLGEISRMVSALDLTNNVKETASVLFKQAYKNNVLTGTRSIEGVATASIYLASHIEQTPRTLSELQPVSRVDIDRYRSDANELRKSLSLGIEPTDPQEYIHRFANKADLGPEVITEAKRIGKAYRKNNGHRGDRPSTVAITSIYVATLNLGIFINQEKFLGNLPLSTVALRKKFKLLLDSDPKFEYEYDEIEDNSVGGIRRKIKNEN